MFSQSKSLQAICMSTVLEKALRISDSSPDKIMIEVILLQVPDCKSFLKVIQVLAQANMFKICHFTTRYCLPFFDLKILSHALVPWNTSVADTGRDLGRLCGPTSAQKKGQLRAIIRALFCQFSFKGLPG